MLWVALLITVAGYGRKTWYLMGVGIGGISCHITAAGSSRRPEAFGIHLDHEDTIVDGIDMAVLSAVETAYPQAGAALVPEFFPGELRFREAFLWSYAKRRADALVSSEKAHNEAQKRANLRLIRGSETCHLLFVLWG